MCDRVVICPTLRLFMQVSVRSWTTRWPTCIYQCDDEFGQFPTMRGWTWWGGGVGLSPFRPLPPLPPLSPSSLFGAREQNFPRFAHSLPPIFLPSPSLLPPPLFPHPHPPPAPHLPPPSYPVRPLYNACNMNQNALTTYRPWASIDPPPPLVGILKTYMVK